MNLRVLAAAAALAVPGFLGSPAHAADVGIVVGTGTISPGVPSAPTSCVNNAKVNFSGTAATLGTSLPPGPYSVTFAGNSNTCESVLTGAGTGTLSGDVAGSVTYARTTGIISLNGVVTVASQTRTLAATCTVVITSAEPIDEYTVECAVTL